MKAVLFPGASAAGGRAGGDASAPCALGLVWVSTIPRHRLSQLWVSALLCFLQQVKLEEFGRPKIDGELKVRSIVNHTKQDR